MIPSTSHPADTPYHPTINHFATYYTISPYNNCIPFYQHILIIIVPQTTYTTLPSAVDHYMVTFTLPSYHDIAQPSLPPQLPLPQLYDPFS
ncbi:hypothetical protein RB195_009566 [Necator americanus]|uniref:Uncharacterized protein n=1 Tax=Necator americanus TaxID=51031 RepID=A0ABR1CVR7_NECAM